MLRSFRQLGVGILIGFFSAVLILGAFLLVFTEGGQFALLPAASPTITPAPVVIVPGQPIEAPPPTATTAPSPTPVPPVSCPPPPGWWAYTTSSGETLAGLAAQFKVSVEDLKAANCLPGDLVAGMRLYLPPQPTVALQNCGNPPAGWLQYTIQPGQNLYRLAQHYGLETSVLAFYNCIPDPDLIIAGQKIWVPAGSTVTVSPTASLTPTASPSPSATATASNTPTATGSPTASATPVTPTDTPTPSPTTAP